MVHGVLSSPGQPLDAKTRSFFEPRFGLDFSRVCIHTDERAAASARAVNALAYTVGHQLVFESGRFDPRGGTGQKLIAHELAHVVQQSSNHNGHSELTVTAADDAFETEPRNRRVEVWYYIPPSKPMGEGLRMDSKPQGQRQHL